MPGQAQDQPLNLKHRLTGAVILIGIAVAVMSLVLDSDPADPVAEVRQDEPRESFVSRISSAEDNEEFRVPAPATAPDEPRAPLAQAPDELVDGTLPDAGDAPGSSTPTQAGVGEPALNVEPVLEQATRLPGPAPKINTVDVSPVGGDGSTSRPGDAAAEVASVDSWVVRVGAFSEQSNARGVSQRLREGGYDASSASVTVNGKSMVRVWVGPFPDRKSAVRAKSDLSRQFGLDGFVARQP